MRRTRAVRQESARVASARDHPESTPERRVSLLRFCDHGLVRIIRNLTVKKYLGAALTLPMIYWVVRKVRADFEGKLKRRRFKF